MEGFLEHYQDLEYFNTTEAQKAINLQQQVDEEETTYDPAKINWASLRTNDEACKIICGFTIEEFLDIFEIVEDAIPENVGRGRRSKISKKDKLVMVLCFLKYYETLDKMRLTFSISKPHLCKILTDTIDAISPILYDHFVSELDERVEKENAEEEENFPEAKFVMDATFQTIWTPTGTYNEKKQFFSGKHKLYGLKSQCIHDRQGRLVNCVAGQKGSMHDFTICRSNMKMLKEVLLKDDDSFDEDDQYWCVIVDSGYQGLQKLVPAIMPHKKKANEELSERQKKFNKKVATERVICERFYGRLKVKFRIMSSKYRNAREDYEKIFKLCVALTNYDIILHPL